MIKSFQKKLDGMEIIELARAKIKPSFNFREARTPGKVIFFAENLVIGYINHRDGSFDYV